MSLRINIEKEIETAGDEDILADMIIAENPKLYGYHKSKEATKRLLRKEWMYSGNKWINEKSPVSLSRRGELWTEDEISTLKRLYKTHTNKQIALRLRRTPAGVYHRISNLLSEERRVKKPEQRPDIIQIYPKRSA